VIETLVAATPERCFDLARSVELHLESAAATGERAVAGTTSGLLGAGDVVTWEARHLGLRLRMTVRITTFEPPLLFRDEQVEGPFRRLVHDHRFEPVAAGTRMTDVVEFATLVPPLDALVVAPHLRRFLERRNETIRRAAEG
jgi:ligand-binding SRPBCC domain-containing protein